MIKCSCLKYLSFDFDVHDEDDIKMNLTQNLLSSLVELESENIY